MTGHVIFTETGFFWNQTWQHTFRVWWLHIETVYLTVLLLSFVLLKCFEVKANTLSFLLHYFIWLWITYVLAVIFLHEIWIYGHALFPSRAKAHTLVDSLSELMVDASLGTIQCLEEIVSVLLHYPNQTLFAKLQFIIWIHLTISCTCGYTGLQQDITRDIWMYKGIFKWSTTWSSALFSYSLRNDLFWDNREGIIIKFVKYGPIR